MVSFASDYITGAHPEILKRLSEINQECLPGYGTDSYCAAAAEKIRQACACPDADVEFLVGGTQTNLVVIATMLQDHEGVISAGAGHINTHEAGAIELSGHKVIRLPYANVKILPEDLECYLSDFYEDENRDHMVFPGMVYLSHPTEYGTLYSKAELEEIAEICHKYDMTLYLDGARLAYGLMSRETDVTLEDIARICDVFYIGGTKAGAFCGEAVVFTKQNKPKHFMTSVKKRGALLAKGWLLGVQFDTLFTDGLYEKIGKHAIDMAEQMKDIFRKNGIRFYLQSPTNQQFAILGNRQIDELKKTVEFSFWESYDEEHSVVRFATCWSTTQEDLDYLDAQFEMIQRDDKLGCRREDHLNCAIDDEDDFFE